MKLRARASRIAVGRFAAVLFWSARSNAVRGGRVDARYRSKVSTNLRFSESIVIAVGRGAAVAAVQGAKPSVPTVNSTQNDAAALPKRS